ncbi:glucose repression mediator protein [Dipsacomyces acuminosporus]|nr:glucose repression mediator protein [Dipsacomyces acuminosporus]
MSAGMAPPGMLAHGQQLGPQPNGTGQPNGSLQQGPPGPIPLPPNHVSGQQRQPIPPQQGQPPQPPPPQQQQQQQQQGPQQQQQQQQQQLPTPAQRLSSINEKTWMQMGALAEFMNEQERALTAYDSALRHNPYSQAALTQIANIYRSREEFEKAVEYFQRIVNIDNTNGEIWGAIGNCYLMLDELPKAYQAYQQAIYHLPDPKEPKLWYGIGILYDRYGSYDHAEEAFGAVMRMDPNFDKATEIYFRLGIIHKCQGRYEQSLQCFNYILKDPPKPLTETDIWFQIGNVYELQKDYNNARDAYERVLQENPEHGKVLQQLGALYFRPNTNMTNIEAAVQLLMRAIEIDKEKVEAHTWYLLGRCYMVQRLYNKAYEAYQQAVYRDGNNATYWCSIGVLYYQINQFRDALDAYSRAIRINPYLSEVWFDLGALYEACNNQVNDAIDAYTRAAELDRSNAVIEQRLEILRRIQSTGQTSLAHSNPPPQPIDPPAGPTTAGQPSVAGGPSGEPSATAGGAPGSLGAPPMAGPAGSGVPQLQEHMRHPSDSHQQQHPPAQRGGAPIPPGMQHLGQQGVPQPVHSQQQAQPQASMPPPPSHQQKGPSHQQGAVPGGRPGYPDEAGYQRYEGMPRPEAATSGAPQHPSQYPMQQGSANSNAYQPGPYSSAPYSQPPATRPYTTSGMPQSTAAYTSQPQHPPTGPYRQADDRRMSSRTDSPMVSQQHQQQSTPIGDHAAPASTFPQAQANGYAPYPAQPALSDARRYSGSPSQAQEAFRQQDISRQQTREDRPAEYAGAPNNAHSRQSSYGRYPPVKGEGAPAPTGANAYSQPSNKHNAVAHAGDGDVRMEDADKAPGANEKAAQYIDTTPSSSSSSVSSMAAVAPASHETSAPPASSLSGPTAAPIRLPPVQIGGSNSRSPLGSSGAMQQLTLASEDAAKSSGSGLSADGPLSLASAISTADDDNEGSAINSLMSLSNVASTLTSRPQNQSPLPSLSSPSAAQSAKQGASDSLKPSQGSEPPSSIAASASTSLSSSSSTALGATNGRSDTEVAGSAEPKMTDAPAVSSTAASDSLQPKEPTVAAPPSNDAKPGNGDVNGRAAQSSTPPKSSTKLPASTSDSTAPVVPSKRPLSSPAAGPAAEAALPASKAKAEGVDGSKQTGSSVAAADGAGGKSSKDGVNNSEVGPRKRGRQSPPSPFPEKKRAQDDEMEEGEEPEDGEVFEDDEPNDTDKLHKSEDVLMESGKVKHD